MNNYICINGKKTPLSADQIKKLGFSVDSQLEKFVKHVRVGERLYLPGKIIEDFGMKFKILGYSHDVSAETHNSHGTVTLMCLNAPPHWMCANSCPGGWKDSDMRMWLNNDYLRTLPVGLQELIRPTIRKSTDAEGRYHTTTDLLFLPTESELFGSAIYSACECGSRYPTFCASKDRILTDDNGNRFNWWTSSAYAGSESGFVLVNTNGIVNSSHASNVILAPFCFQLS